ncbi:alpha/beta hydrolase fold protein [Enterococcus sp. 8G7_MSG3316]|uniref:Alpha/beta hydrolase fold protein n=1 Tax=Candidatus Enterococcus testudinis TaxID=1834191 RepID=A0A242A2A1_9ENTE|nr:alpha/beta hydrolase [Enterococcus sp. 8G7_MSG3316]OTN75154.1 alpha/beta hydrolase fold protein [Enterococcus sp. 8G7_MSG3316]
MTDRISLEPAAIDFSEENAAHPRIYELPPEEGRALLEKVQEAPIDKYAVDIEDQEIDTGDWGKINVRFVRPAGNHDILPVIYYLHGAGWVFGSAATHDKLIRELAVRTNALVIFPEYSRSPEAKYPTAIEQNYAVLQQLPGFVETKAIDISRLTVAGDSVGGNMATVMALLTKSRGGIPIAQQLLFYPVTDATFDTPSYEAFGEGYYLTKEGMEWFWNQYTTDPEDRGTSTAAPLRASAEELADLPPALIITGEADVLRDEGEAYAQHLREAGVEMTQVRMQGIIHDFVMVHALDQTNAARGAMDLATTWIKQKNQPQ